MPNPINLSPATLNLGLPLLLAGQAQKEFFVNQALALLDAMHGAAVVASLSAPPALAEEGQSFRVVGPAMQGWGGREDHIAIRIGGAWHFVAPQAGMTLFDRTAGYRLVFTSSWGTAAAPAIPAGGSVIDIEARTTLSQLIQALRTIGTLA